MPGPRILLTSDLHYTLRQLDWVADAASGYDLVVLAGDHLDIASVVPLRAQIVAVQAFLRRLSAACPIVVCSGNHDLDGPDAFGEQAATWLADLPGDRLVGDGQSLVLDGTLVTVCPWWDGPLGRARVQAQLEEDAGRRADRWVWVYHWPPTDSLVSWTGRTHYGDADLKAWIEHYRPDIVLTGHVHEPPFKPGGSWADRIGRTWVFNPGRQIGPEPTRVEIDLDAGAATWWSMMGVEQRSLELQ